jgi:membrane protein DedA with SNARE-associated domain
MLQLEIDALKGKASQLLVFAVAVILVLVVSLDTLEDTLIDGGSFSGTPLALLLNAIIVLTQNATATISSFGYVGVFSLMLLESSSLPIPSEIILPFAGYLASQGKFNFGIIVLIATLAGVLGSLIDYHIGLKGIDLIARRRLPGRRIFDEERLETAEKWFKKHGILAVLLSRMVPGFRTLISFPAGATRMSFPKFVAFTAVGCLTWNATLTYVGVYLGANWREVASELHYVTIGVAAPVLIAVIIFLVNRKKRTQASLTQPEAGAAC